MFPLITKSELICYFTEGTNNHEEENYGLALLKTFGIFTLLTEWVELFETEDPDNFNFFVLINEF